jgi:hypothetical protein
LPEIQRRSPHAHAAQRFMSPSKASASLSSTIEHQQEDIWPAEEAVGKVYIRVLQIKSPIKGFLGISGIIVRRVYQVLWLFSGEPKMQPEYVRRANSQRQERQDISGRHGFNHACRRARNHDRQRRARITTDGHQRTHRTGSIGDRCCPAVVYQPMLLNGAPVAVLTKVTVNCTLSQ